MTKLLVADISAVAKSVEKQIISMSGDLTLVGEASTYESMLTEILKCKPDVALIDFNILKANNLFSAYTTLKSLNVPVLLFIDPKLYNEKEIIFKKDVIVCRKPDLFSLSAAQIAEYAKDLEKKLVELKQNSRFGNIIVPKVSVFSKQAETSEKKDGIVDFNLKNKKFKVVLIGVSTGGPGTIQRLLSDLGDSFPLPILITQHIDSNFDKNLIEWLDTNTKLPVFLAEDNMIAENGKVYFAPADYHLLLQLNIKGEIVLRLSHEDQVNFLRPAVDKMFESAAQVIGDKCIGVLLTGMGVDGAKGCVQIKNCGGHTITEAEESCIIYGMPKAAFEAGGSTEVLHLKDIAARLKELTGEK